MGRPAKPKTMHLIEGTFRKDRHDKPTPELEVKRLKAPSSFNAERKKIWKNLVDVLADQMRVLTEADTYTLELLVNKLYEVKLMDRYIKRNGMTFKFKNREGVSYNRVRPEVRLRDQAWEDYVKLSKEFGLSPLSRTKIHIKPSKGVDEIEKRRKKDW